MGKALKIIFTNPYILLGIFFMVIGAASLIYKVVNITKAGRNYVKGNKIKSKESNIQKKALVFVLIAIFVGVIAFIYWLRK